MASLLLYKKWNLADATFPVGASVQLTQKQLNKEVIMRQKLNLTELSRVELADVKGGLDPHPEPVSCGDCVEFLSYLADDAKDACSCASVIYAFGLLY